ncbi:DNA mismatch repair protein MutS [Candidatus Woesearchaeota archaeon]|nr:DNA mismatch repair protein MutS [Candidatus Woesearchaeota archaeon]
MVDTSSSPESILTIDSANLTPGMQQYRDVKQAHPDCLVMLRMGDFYEMFYEDALTASKELEITLTARGKGEKRAPLAGIPYHALDPYLAKLVKKGYKVAIVEQLEDPKLAKGLVKRGLVRIVTPGTVMESSMLEETKNNYIAALTSAGEELAAAFCDLSTGEFFVTMLPTVAFLQNELARLMPRECVVPESLKVNTEITTAITSSGGFLNSVADNYFQAETASQVLQQHFAQHIDVRIESQKPLLAVSGALLRYLMDTQKNALSHLTSITMRSTTSMVLDAATLRNLELVGNLQDGSRRGTLFSVLDRTTTGMGARLLQKWIKEPLLQEQGIIHRFDAIAQLKDTLIPREEIRALLEGIYDMERLISRVNYGNASPRDLLALRNSLHQIPLLKEKLAVFSGELLMTIAGMPGLEETATIIISAIREDAPVTLREGGIIKEGYNQELDQLQDLKRHGRKYLQEIEEQEKQRTGISTLKMGYTNVFGYFLEITKKNIPLVPSHYIRKQTTTNSERYVTEQLKLEEEKILGAQEKIEQLEYVLYQELLKIVARRTTEIQDAARNVALLDVLCSLGKVALEQNYCRPSIVKEQIVQLKKSRHPVLEIMQDGFIPNDITLHPGEMMIITGPNMSGKSSLMRQVALSVLMAQMGSFVPAGGATLGIVDRIFTRVGAQDNLSVGQSTFMVEMNETASILHQATERSLIILDEIGRGTSTFDGVSIAWSVAEYIYNKIRARTLFSTHYHVMNKLAEKFSNVKNYNLTVKEAHGDVIFLYHLMEGGTDQSYGVHVAKLAGLPAAVVERAREIQQILEKDDEMMRRIQAKRMEEQKGLGEF